MSWMDWGDVRKQRGITAKKLGRAGGVYVDGDKAANDAARGIRSDKERKVRKVKGLKGQARKDLSPTDIRKLEGIAKVRERGKKITEADKAYLRRMGFPLHKDM